MFLTDEQLSMLTGYKRRQKQILWLRAHNFPLEVSASGRPIVASREVERRLSLDLKIRVKDRPRLEFVR